MRDSIIVYKRKLAMQLVREHFTVVDIQPHKDNKDYTIFFFKNEEGLLDRIKALNAENTRIAREKSLNPPKNSRDNVLESNNK